MRQPEHRWLRVARWISRRALRWFFRDVRIVGAERVPMHGPAVLVANHPNDLPDVLICYLTTSRPVHFVATVSGATSPIARWTYRALDVIPVSRIRDARRMLADGADPAEVNRAAYRAVIAALNAGDIVAIFPEGGVHDGYELGQLRSGVAKMLLETLDSGALMNIPVIPIGLQYEAKEVTRTSVVAVVGEPLLVGQDYRHLLGARQLTADIRNRLRSVTRNTHAPEVREALDVQAACLGAVLASDEPPLVVAGRVAPMLGRLSAVDASDSTELHAVARALGSIVEKNGGRAVCASDHAALLKCCRVREGAEPAESTISADRQTEMRRQDDAPSTWLLIAAAPAALIAWALHAVPFLVVWRQATRYADGPAEIVARAIVPGLYIVVFWYLVVSGAAAAGLWATGRPIWLALILFVSLPRIGDLAIWWRNGVAARRYYARVNALTPVQRAEVAELDDRARRAWARTIAIDPSLTPIKRDGLSVRNATA